MLRFSTEDQCLTFQQVTEAVQYWCWFSPSSVSDMTLWKNSCWNWAYFEWIAITQTLGFRSLHCPPWGLWIQLHWALHSPFQWMKWCRFTGEGYGVSSPMVRCSAVTSLPLSIIVRCTMFLFLQKQMHILLEKALISETHSRILLYLLTIMSRACYN